MLPFKAIRSTISQGLKAVLGVPIIEMNGGGKMPVGSFLTYHFDDVGSADASLPTLIQQGDILLRQKTVNFTVSFLSFADLSEDSIELAMKVQDWFKTLGAEQLRDKLDVVVVKLGEVENRDINIGEEWERRHGFEVDFRATDIAEAPLKWIETVTIKKE